MTKIVQVSYNFSICFLTILLDEYIIDISLEINYLEGESKMTHNEKMTEDLSKKMQCQHFNYNEFSQELKDFFAQDENLLPIVFFGAGYLGITALHFFKELNLRIPVLFCDNDPRKQGTDIEGIKIVSLDEMLEKNHDCIVVLTVSEVFSSILLKQANIHIKKERIYEFPILYRILNATKDLSNNDQIVKEFDEDVELYTTKNTYKNFEVRKDCMYPILNEKYAQAGRTSIYFWQDLWGTKWVHQRNPEHHYDIGSRIDGFIAHLLSFRKNIHVIDVRPLDSNVPNMKFTCADATNMESFEDNSIESLSALCSIEHFGLGRYGDPIDPSACFKAFDAVQRILKPGGDLYLSVPVGKERLEFNAHRIFDPKTIVNSFPLMELIEFKNIQPDYATEPVLENINHFSEIEGTGLFYFRKK